MFFFSSQKKNNYYRENESTPVVPVICGRGRCLAVQNFVRQQPAQVLPEQVRHASLLWIHEGSCVTTRVVDAGGVVPDPASNKIPVPAVKKEPDPAVKKKTDPA